MVDKWKFPYAGRSHADLDDDFIENTFINLNTKMLHI